jgi:hypothetical protein
VSRQAVPVSAKRIDWQREEEGLYSCADAEVFIMGDAWIWLTSRGDEGGPFVNKEAAMRDFERWSLER